jgi:hypothetical protein
MNWSCTSSRCGTYDSQPTAAPRTNILQRACACGKHAAGGTCEACRRKGEGLQRAARTATAPEIAPDSVRETLGRSGQPLPPDTRTLLESRFGQDFSAVRVHTDAAAQRSADEVDALAYTVGPHIAFGLGQYAPSTASGQQLLAHELVHVVQQSGRGVPAGPIRIDSSPHLEAEAGRAAAGQAPFGVASAGLSLQAKGKGSAAGPGMCGGAWTCAASPCDQPDPGHAGNGTTPTEWTLKVRIDTEAPTPEDVGPNTFGHTYVELNDSSGAVWTYGFYPNKATGTPDPMLKPVVGGCTVHPDTGHESCVDYTETFKLTKPEFDKALNFATLMCKAPSNYNVLTFNCTTFADVVARQAGKSLPPIRGTLGSSIKVTADNPNTLLEGLKDRDIPSRHATSDTDIRTWVFGADSKTIAALPAAEKVRLVNRLIDGWVAEGDIAAVEKICGAITSATEMKSIRDAVGGRESELNKAQGGRFHAALNRI